MPASLLADWEVAGFVVVAKPAAVVLWSGGADPGAQNMMAVMHHWCVVGR